METVKAQADVIGGAILSLVNLLAWALGMDAQGAMLANAAAGSVYALVAYYVRKPKATPDGE
jgi:hypothetical protein